MTEFDIALEPPHAASIRANDGPWHAVPRVDLQAWSRRFESAHRARARHGAWQVGGRRPSREGRQRQRKLGAHPARRREVVVKGDFVGWLREAMQALQEARGWP